MLPNHTDELEGCVELFQLAMQQSIKMSPMKISAEELVITSNANAS
jgi:hypothetical protein